MKVLAVGGGGREHAIVQALRKGEARVFSAMKNRNPGIARASEDFKLIKETDVEKVVDFATASGVEMAVVGPEAPLEAGLVNELESKGISCVGPTKEAARIETSKSFMRDLMSRHGIPGNLDFQVFESFRDAKEYVEGHPGQLAVKPVGLTGGKGVRVTGDQLATDAAVDYILDAEWHEWVIEERLVGEEFTVQAFVANGEVRTTPAIQDHKRAYEGDEGPNTGGMGSYSDTSLTLPFMTDADYEAAVEVIEAVVDALPEYKGVLYGQFMLGADGPKVVEFNARFGDPEAMNTLPILETPFLEVLTAARDGDDLPELDFSGEATVCKYAVPDGYPTDPDAGAKIEVNEETVGDGLLFYASVDAREDGLYTTTSRSFAVVGHADSIAAAEEIAEDALAAAGEGFHIRHDIGTADLVQSRIDHMNELRGE